MRAVYIVKNGSAKEAFEIRETEEPEVSKGHVKIKVEGFGLNFADVMARQGLYREAPPLPCIVGYEVVGTITEVGEDVVDEWVGKRVLAFTRFGAYAEVVVTDARAVVEISNDIDVVSACALAVQYTTAWFSAVEKVSLHENDNVLIHAGAGGVGTALIQIAQMKGCNIFTTVGSDEKVKFLQEKGIKHVINYNKVDYEKEISRLLGKGKRIDAAFNAVGGKTFKKDKRLMGHGASIVCFGAADRSGKKGGFFQNLKLVFQMGFVHPLFLMMRSQSVIGVNMLAVSTFKPNVLQKCMKEVFANYKNGNFKPVSGGKFTIDQLAEAHEKLEKRGTVGKLAVVWEQTKK